MVSQPQIPVIVLAGFLGSGKTTLLNHLLHSSRGSRIGAVVNDFGAIEIDAMAVAGQLGDSTVSLGNGCLCCAVDAGELDTYLERLARPSARIDLIVIEASGLAEPQELVRMVLAGEHPRVVYGGLVEVVDAVEFDATRERHPELDRHLGIADLVVVNKADRVPDAELERVLGVVGGLVDRAAVVTAAYGRIDPGLLFDRKPVEERVGQLSFDDLAVLDGAGAECGGGRPREGHSDQRRSREGHSGQRHSSQCHSSDGHSCDGRSCDRHSYDDHLHRGHLHTAYESVAFTSDVPLHPRRLMNLLDSRPDGLYRIKGYVDFGAAAPRHRYAVHAVGRFLRFYPEPLARDESRRTQLVLIGSGIDASALYKELETCQVSAARAGDREHGADPYGADAPGMWGVLRYVQDPEARSDTGLDASPAPDSYPL